MAKPSEEKCVFYIILFLVCLVLTLFLKERINVLIALVPLGILVWILVGIFEKKKNKQKRDG